MYQQFLAFLVWNDEMAEYQDPAQPQSIVVRNGLNHKIVSILMQTVSISLEHFKQLVFVIL